MDFAQTLEQQQRDSTEASVIAAAGRTKPVGAHGKYRYSSAKHHCECTDPGAAETPLSDAQLLLQAEMDRLEQAAQAEIDRLEHLASTEAARADYILEAAEQNIDAFAQTLEQQARRHRHRQQAELQRQRQILAQAAAEELVRERRQRMTALKEVCSKGFCVCFWGGGRRG